MDKILKEIRESQEKLGQAMDDLLAGKITVRQGRAIAKAEGVKAKGVQAMVAGLVAQQPKKSSHKRRKSQPMSRK